MKYIGIICFFWSVAFSQANQVDAKGLKQGVWRKNYPGTRIPIYEGTFKDDKPVGVFRYYYESGAIKAVIDNKPNNNLAIVKMYFENQSLMSEGFYRNQKKDSIWVNYNEAGELLSTEMYANDMLNGKKIVYYLKDQLEFGTLNVLSICYYENNLRNGNYKEYHPSGKLKINGDYLKGQRVGEWQEYYNSGQIMSKQRYKSDKLHGWSYFYDKNGSQLSKSMWRADNKLEGKELQEYLDRCKKNNVDPNQ